MEFDVVNDSKRQTIAEYTQQAEDCLGRAWDPQLSPESRMVFVEMAKCYTELAKSLIDLTRVRNGLAARGVEWTVR